MNTEQQQQESVKTADPLQATPQHGGEVRSTQLTPANGHANEHPEKEHDHNHEEVIPHDLKQPGKGTIMAIAIAVVVLMIVMFFVGWLPAHHRAGEAEADANERAGALPVVSTTQPTLPSAQKEILLPCDVRANQDTMLYSRSTGFLKKWYVDIHDRVTAGQVLATIDIPDVDAQLAASKAALEQSKAAVDKAKSDLGLAQKTLDRYLEAQRTTKGAVTEEDLDTRVAMRDQAASALKQAEANVGAAQADVQRQQVLAGFETIYAPFNGVITFRGYDNGALINASDLSAGKELFRVQQTDPLRVFVSVPQAYSTQLSIGQPADLLVRNYLEPFHGTVTRTSASIDTATRTMSFQIDFPNADNKLFPGMYGQVRLPINQKSTTLTIPASALVFNAGGAQVVVIRDNKAHYQKISIGRDLGTELEVLDGLTSDDHVDMNPDERITENGEVQLKSTETKPTATAGTPANDKVAGKG